MVRDGNAHDPCTGNHVVIGHKEDIDERCGVSTGIGWNRSRDSMN